MISFRILETALLFLLRVLGVTAAAIGVEVVDAALVGAGVADDVLLVGVNIGLGIVELPVCDVIGTNKGGERSIGVSLLGGGFSIDNGWKSIGINTA